jgi:hypothetical protein
MYSKAHGLVVFVYEKARSGQGAGFRFIPLRSAKKKGFLQKEEKR